MMTSNSKNYENTSTSYSFYSTPKKVYFPNDDNVVVPTNVVPSRNNVAQASTFDMPTLNKPVVHLPALNVSGTPGLMTTYGESKIYQTSPITSSMESRKILKNWMFDPKHFSHPYPNEREKEALAAAAGITKKQLCNWFTNARKRLWQPVLIRMGVDVKKYLSTGRGGTRGRFINVPRNVNEILASLSNNTARDATWSSTGLNINQ